MFWSIIGLLIIATAVVFFMKRPASTAPEPRIEQTVVANAAPQQLPAPLPLPKTEIAQPEIAQSSAPNPLARRVRNDHEHAAKQPDNATGSGDLMSLLFGTAPNSADQVSEDVRTKDEASRKARITKLPDGAIEIDDRFTIRGKGSEREPFIIPWELMLSAKEVYVPRDGRTVIPGRVEMLQSTWVSITGYVMLPTVRDRVREFVMMQNQWDGCCIGVPPTPYDSIEITLAEPIDFGFGGRQYATVTGRMRVEPYLFAERMLLGLFAIEDARIKVTEW